MKNILLVEDDQVDVIIFKRHLSGVTLDNRLTVAKSINEAVIALSQNNFDVIFCDYNLPDASAIDLVSAMDNSDELPIIVLTSHGKIEIATEALKKGASDFITKDNLNTPELERLIRISLKKREDFYLRKTLEEEITRNFSNTKAILENSTDGIWSLDTLGRVLIINSIAQSQMAEHLDKTPEVGDSFLEMLTEPFYFWQELFDEALTGKNKTRIDKYEDQGRTFFLEVSVSPIYNESKITGVTFFGRDVSERQRSLDLIAENEKNFRTLFEASDLAILIENKLTNQIVDLNEACARLHGYSKEEMMQMSIFDTIPDNHLKLSQENFKLYQSGELNQLDSFILTKSDESIPVNITVNKITYNGISCHQIFYQDISLRKETELRLKQAKELAEQSAEFKAKFLANMSHEIRTPLNAMFGFIELVLGTSLTEEQDSYLKIVKSSSTDLLAIINDILDLSKMEAGKMVLNHEPFSIDELVKKLTQLHTYKAEDKGIKLDVFKSEYVKEWYIGDEVKLTQILNNLISNALKFTDQGAVMVRVDHDGSDLVFEVSDTGSGIPESQQQFIFESFNQLSSNEERKHKGTGLGLSIVSELVQLMKGKLSLKSKEGEGASFKVLVPLESTSAPSNIKQLDVSEIVLKGVKVLMCEDNELNSLLAEKNLKPRGVELRVAADGAKGILEAKSFKPDVILMDLRMPIMDGYEATKNIRKFSQVPIIAMTANVYESEKEKCREHGMNGFITKPFKQKDLIAGIGNVLNLDVVPEEETASKKLELGLPLLESHADGDIDFIDQLFIRYLNNCADCLKDIDNKDLINCQQEASHHAHKLRSGFTLFEFDELKNLSVIIEEGTASNDDFNEFKASLKRSVEFIQDKKGQMKSFR